VNTGIQRIYKSESTQYTTVPNWVVRDPSYSPNCFRLLAYLLSHQSGYELTYGQIERQTTLGRYAINEAGKFLISQGWLEWRQDKGSDGKYLAKTWIITNPTIVDDSIADEPATESFHYGTTNGHREEHLKEKQTVKRTTLKEPLANKGFDHFWAEYPRKLDKGQAQKAFKLALTKASIGDIMTGLAAYKSDSTRKQEFTKYPATWLNAESWLNEVALSPDSEAGQRAKLRRDRDKEISNAYLQEQRDAQAYSAAPPQCLHGSTIARCVKCSRGLNA